MHYELNVAYKGRHLFATNERSIRDTTQLVRVWKLFNKKFKAKDGFSINANTTIVNGFHFDTLEAFELHEKNRFEETWALKI